jgi:hypothetical protein
MPETMKQERKTNVFKVNSRVTVVNLAYTKPLFSGPFKENMPMEPQTELFSNKEENIEIFIHSAMVIIRSLTPPFYMSTIEKHLVRMPANPKWLGLPLTNTMKASGYYTTGRCQKSPNPSRRGGLEQEWDRRNNASV